ncbi:MAG: hypothetical protein M0Z31_07255 [Clostridia bacterium]|nr:hypothetical protein [Clostridia bacterium]
MPKFFRYLGLLLAFFINWPLVAWAAPGLDVQAPGTTNRPAVVIRGNSDHGARIIINPGTENPFQGSFDILGPTPDRERFIPQGLKFAGDKFFFSAYTKEGESKIYLLDKAFQVTGSFLGPQQGRHISGLAWDGQYLWVTEFDFNRVYKLDLNRALQDGHSDNAVLGSFSTGLVTTSALEYVYGNLLISDYDNTRRIYQVNPETSLNRDGMDVIGSFTVPRGSQGMVHVDGFLYHSIGDANPGHQVYLQKLDLTESLKTGTAVEVARYFAPGGVQDVAYDGKFFYTSSESFNQFYRYNKLVDITTQDPYGRFQKWLNLKDGENLYTVTAIDHEGHYFSIARQIVLDQIKPPLSVDLPQMTDEPVVWVNGWTEQGARTKVNGKNAANREGYFQQSVNLKMGNNTIVVTSTDRAGNVSTITRQVKYQPPPTPDFDITGLSKKKKGKSYFLTITVANKGTKAATAALVVKNTKGKTLWQGSTGKLAPGKSKTVKVRVKSNSGQIQVDPGDKVKELNERNNTGYY